MYGQGGCKLEINIPPQQIYARGELIMGGIMSSEYSNKQCALNHDVHLKTQFVVLFLDPRQYPQ